MAHQPAHDLLHVGIDARVVEHHVVARRAIGSVAVDVRLEGGRGRALRFPPGERVGLSDHIVGWKGGLATHTTSRRAAPKSSELGAGWAPT